MITSPSNQRIKNVIQLVNRGRARREQNCYIVEGIRMFREAPREQIREIYMTNRLCEKESLSDCFSWGIPCELVSEEVFARISDTKTPQGILCVMERPAYDLDTYLAKQNGLWIVLENLQDPGNLGTIFRTGEAAGVTGIIMNSTTVDIFNPKSIRSTMGSVYRVPFFIVPELKDVFEKFQANEITSYAADLKAEISYDKQDYSRGTAFLIGNEGNGLTKETAALATKYLRIPMEGQVESLNAAMACGILIYEAHRQRGVTEWF
ncbi:MAG: RNA methyltransferase [Lachnospiraceae bacterium]|jgi:TrmH family RNA methyltransferase|nr:RNA methyltransferase [Lachnospiraceae bacterium]